MRVYYMYMTVNKMQQIQYINSENPLHGSESDIVFY